MIKFTNIDQGIIQASRTILTNDGLDSGQVDTYMATHQAPLIAAGRAVIENSNDIKALSDLRAAIRGYIDANPA